MCLCFLFIGKETEEGVEEGAVLARREGQAKAGRVEGTGNNMLKRGKRQREGELLTIASAAIEVPRAPVRGVSLWIVLHALRMNSDELPCRVKAEDKHKAHNIRPCCTDEESFRLGWLTSATISFF